MRKRRRTIDQARLELNKLLPEFEGHGDYLVRVLEHMDLVRPARKRQTLVFRLYYGLSGREPMTLKEIASEFQRSSARVRRMREDARRWLTDPHWQVESEWPEPEVVPVRTGMKDQRVREIALLVLMRHYRSIGTKRFLQELKAAAPELAIEDGEMQEFFQAISGRLMRRKT